jgi:hypothetical protein
VHGDGGTGEQQVKKQTIAHSSMGIIDARAANINTRKKEKATSLRYIFIADHIPLLRERHQTTIHLSISNSKDNNPFCTSPVYDPTPIAPFIAN